LANGTLSVAFLPERGGKIISLCWQIRLWILPLRRARISATGRA